MQSKAVWQKGVIILDSVIEQIKAIAARYNIDKLVLFGSRARGDYTVVSDYDIAVFEKNMPPLEKAYFSNEVEEIKTLKKIDLVFVKDNGTDGILKNIKRDGVIIYEQVYRKVN